MEPNWTLLRQQLLAPFEPAAIEWRDQAGMHLAYLKEDALRRRLDEVVPGWECDLEPVPEVEGRAFICRITIHGKARSDVGEWSKDSTGTSGKGMTDYRKAAATDAFKRAAQKWWVGNFLEYLPKRNSGNVTVRDVEQACRRAGWDGVTRPASAPASVSREGTPAPAPGRAAAANGTHTTPGQSVPPPPGSGSPSPVPTTAGQQRAHQAVRAAEAETVRGQVQGGLLPPAQFRCSNELCSTEITERQHTVSLKAFGEPFCPKCQQLAARQRAG